MLKVLKYKKKRSSQNLEAFLNKRRFIQKSQTSAVNIIIQNVKKNGDKAVLNYEKKFSKIKTNSSKIYFSVKELNVISKKIDKNIKQAIDQAYNRIKKFHSKQKFISFSYKDKYKNELSYKYSPIEKVELSFILSWLNSPSIKASAQLINSFAMSVFSNEFNP